MIKLVVFDMAGTVVDENNVVYKTLQKALNNAGVNVTLNEVLTEGAGKEKLRAITDIATKRGASGISAMYEEFVTMLDVAYEELDVRAMKGAEEAFEQLKSMGVRRVLNTGYASKTALQLINKLGWKKGVHYDELITATDVMKTRPNPDMIFKAMEKLGVGSASYVVKIGDSIVDIEEGKNAGCGLTIGITTGAHTRGQLLSAQPDHIIDGLDELIPLIALQPTL